MTSRRMRRIIFLVASVALAMAILLAFVAEVLDYFDYWSPHADYSNIVSNIGRHLMTNQSHAEGTYVTRAGG